MHIINFQLVTQIIVLSLSINFISVPFLSIKVQIITILQYITKLIKHTLGFCICWEVFISQVHAYS